mgnify:CR=1 FL=1
MKEIRKWMERIEKIKFRVRNKNEKYTRYEKNINAYIKDSKYWLKKNELIKSFEALIWAWAWLEILKELDIIEVR